jgi:hypothetical protein
MQMKGGGNERYHLAIGTILAAQLRTRTRAVPKSVFVKHIADSIAQNALLSAHVISLHLTYQIGGRIEAGFHFSSNV